MKYNRVDEAPFWLSTLKISNFKNQNNNRAPIICKRILYNALHIILIKSSSTAYTKNIRITEKKLGYLCNHKQGTQYRLGTR